MSDRLEHLSELVGKIADARAMTTSNVWAKAWEEIEQELLERLLKCGPEDDTPRYRLQQSIEVARRLRRMIETQARDPGQLEKELAHLEGRAMRPIA